MFNYLIRTRYLVFLFIAAILLFSIPAQSLIQSLNESYFLVQENIDPTDFSPGFTIHDRFGNELSPEDLQTDFSPSADILGGGCNCPNGSGIFELTFEDVCIDRDYGFSDPTLGPARQAVVCQMFADLSELLNPDGSIPTDHVRILVAPSEGFGVNVLNGVIARASPVIFTGFVGGISPGMVMRAVQSNADPYRSMQFYDNTVSTTSAHGQIRFNFQDFDFFLNTNPADSAPSTLHDLYTVALHESLHLLGFYSLIDAENNNQSLIGLSNYSKYDTRIRTVGGGNLTSNGTPNYLNYPTSIPYEVDVATNSIVQDPLCSADAEYSGDALPSQDLYLPFPWRSSGLSHLNCDPTNKIGLGCATNNGYVMNVCGPPGYNQRSPAPEEVDILCDLGYTLNSQYGTDSFGGSTGGNIPFAEYEICTQETCNAIGVNDFFPLPPLVAYSDGAPLQVPANEFLENDINAAGYVPNSFEMVATSINGGEITDTGGGLGFTFVANGQIVGEYVVARYLPMCADGTPGTWAYLFIAVYVRSNCLLNSPCPLTSDCNLICDGSFEGVTNQNRDCHLDFRTTSNSPTSDIYWEQNSYQLITGEDAPNYCGNTYPGGILLPIEGDQHIGLTSNPNNVEAWEFKLRSPLEEGQLYHFSYWLNSGCDVDINFGFSTTKACPEEMSISILPAMLNSEPVDCETYTYNLQIIDRQESSTDIDSDNVPDWVYREFEFTATEASRFLLLFLDVVQPPDRIYTLFDDLRITAIPNPNITLSHQLPEVICPGETVDIPITVCSDTDPGSINLDAYFDTFNLFFGSGGDFIAGSATLTDFVEQDGQFCQTAVLQVIIGEDVDISIPNLLNVTIDPNGACLPTEDYVINFDLTSCPPVTAFACACDDPGMVNYNIDAGDGLSITETPLWDLATANALSPATYDNTNGCIAIKGRLLIDETAPGEVVDFGILGGEIRMQPGAEIVISSYAARLALQDVNQGQGIHGCEEMWQGITSTRGTELFMQNCELSDAAFGVTMNAKSVIDLIENSFASNYITLYTEAGGEIKAIDFDGVTPLVKNSFKGGVLLPPYEGQNAHIGIFLNNAVMEIGQSEDPTNRNTFQGLNNGIVTSETAVAIHGIEVTNLPNLTFNLSDLEVHAGTGILLQNSSGIAWKNDISSSSTNNIGILAHRASLDARNNALTTPWGIELLDANNEEFTAIGNNVTVNDGGAGILMFNSDAISTAIIDANTFSSTTTERVDFIWLNNPGIPVLSGNKVISDNIFTIPTENQRAINLVNVGLWNVLRSDIDYTGDGNTTNQGTIGIVSFGCEDLLFRDNNIDAIHPGAFYHGLMLSNTTASEACCSVINNGHTNMFFFGHSEGTTARHTDLGNATVGLDVWAGTTIGQLTENQQGLVSFVHRHTGNLWNGTYSLVGARNLSANFDITQSRFLVEGFPSPPIWPPSISTPSSSIQWFVVDDGTASTCETDNFLCPSTILAGEEETDLTQYKDYIFTGQHSDMLNWERDQYRLRKLSGIPDLQSRSNTLFDFYSSSITTEVGQFQLLRNSIKNQYDYAQDYYVRVNDIRDISSRLVSLYQALEVATDEVAIGQLLAERELTIEALATSWEQFIPLKSAEIESQKQEALNLLSGNANLPVSSIFAQNEQVVNDLYLSKIASESYELSVEEFAAIQSIAEQCVMEGGKAVYRARALYQLAENRWFEDNCPLVQAYQASGDEARPSNVSTIRTDLYSETVAEIQVYPNPTQQYLSIELPNDFSDKKIEFKLLTINGQQLQTWTPSRSLSQQLDIRGMPTGTYWLSIIIDGSFLVNRRIVILP